VGADGVDHGRLLADEEMTRAMEHQAALLLGRLGRDEPHGRPPHRFANGFRVGDVVLLPLDVGFYVGGRHQAHGVAERRELARPMMRRRAGLETDQAGRQFLKERQNVMALQLAADDHLPLSVDAVNLKNGLRDVESDRRDPLHVWLRQIVTARLAVTSLALTCWWKSRPQHHERTSDRRS
jgi:hypothetical protein